MDWWAKGLLTMGSVALVLVLARRWGGGAAGIVAGLPTTTAPALGWMAHEQGASFAAHAAAATVAACALMAAFALAYAHASLRLRPRGVALAWGAAAALAMVGPVLAAGRHLLPAVGLAAVCSLLAWRAWPAHRPGAVVAAAPPRVWAATALPAIVAGVLSLVPAAAGPLIGTLAAGLLASLPVVSITVAMARHADAGPAAARQFLLGTVAGLAGRMAFGTVFATALPGLGLGAALGLAAAATLLVNLGCMAALPGQAPAGPAPRDPRYRGATRQTVLDRSSATNSSPRGDTATPTGRPMVLPSAWKPVTKSIGDPLGRPPLNGTNTTL